MAHIEQTKNKYIEFGFCFRYNNNTKKERKNKVN
jgi:hypothetical protein